MFGYSVMGAAGNILASAAATHIANKESRRAAREQREWAERMAQSSHQFEVKDLRAAGLNPILSAGGSGASVPGGSSAAQVHKLDTSGIGQIFSDAAALSQIQLSESQRDLNAAQAAKIDTETQFNLNSLKDRVNQESEKVKNLEESREHMRSNRMLNYDKTLEMDHKIDAAKENVNLLRQQVRGQELNNLYRQKELSWFNATNSARVANDFAGFLGNSLTSGSRAGNIIKLLMKGK